MSAPSQGQALHVSVKVGADEVIARCLEAIAAARVYFGISNEWEIYLEPSDGADGVGALIVIRQPYLKAKLSISIEYYMRVPERLWPDMGHEVGHMMTAEVMHLWNHMPPDWAEEGKLGNDMLRSALENTTMRLERMFIRDVPDPHAPQPGGTP